MPTPLRPQPRPLTRAQRRRGGRAAATDLQPHGPCFDALEARTLMSATVPDGYGLLETIEIGAGGQQVVSTSTLELDRDYFAAISGTYDLNENHSAKDFGLDAEYKFRNGKATDINKFGHDFGVQLGLGTASAIDLGHTTRTTNTVTPLPATEATVSPVGF